MTERFLSKENYLIVLAHARSLRWPSPAKPLYPVAVLLFGALSPFFGQLLIVVPLLLLFMAAGLESPKALLPNFNPDAGMSIQLMLTFAPLYGLVWAWLRFFEHRALWTAGLELRHATFFYIRGLIVGLLMFSSAIAIMALFGWVAPEPGAESLLIVDGMAWLGALLVFGGWMVQGGAEELMTRGFLLPILGLRWRVWIGVLLSSLVFSLLHSFNPNLTLIALLNLFLFGLFTAFYALREGGLWGVFAFHGIWNWIQGSIYGFEISGQAFDSSIVLDLMEVGPDWLTGGAFGPEGGIIVTLVLVIGTLYTAFGMTPCHIPPPGTHRDHAASDI